MNRTFIPPVVALPFAAIFALACESPAPTAASRTHPGTSGHFGGGGNDGASGFGGDGNRFGNDHSGLGGDDRFDDHSSGGDNPSSGDASGGKNQGSDRGSTGGSAANDGSARAGSGVAGSGGTADAAGTRVDGTDGNTGAGGSAATCPASCATGQICLRGQCASKLTGVSKLDTALLGSTERFNTSVLLSQQPDLSWTPSSIYKWQDFLQALATMYESGVGEFKFWLGDPNAPEEARTKQALVNVAAFIAQSMKETIQYDACDENNWDTTNGYKLSNSCGQLGQKYEDYDCDMACPKDPTMAITAVTHAKWYGAPGPFFCAPKEELIRAGVSKDGSTGYWNYSADCWPYPAAQQNFVESTEPAWKRAQCQIYAGQKAGGYVFDGTGGSVEGCCWWGRGVIQTTGRCNFGRLNHYLGRSHLTGDRFARPATVLYPDVDFCKDPEVICSSSRHPELKWIAGLFYWMSSVQAYDVSGWKYLEKLRAFVEGGMTEASFINSVSGIVNRGCHDAPCETGPVDGGPERLANFDRVLSAFGLR